MKTLILRAGAAGDLLFIQPALRKLAETKDITIACMPRFHWIWKNQSPIKLKTFPVAIDDEFRSFDEVINLEYIDMEIKGKHPVDSFASRLGVKFENERERIPFWNPDNEVYEKMVQLYPKKHKRIGFSFLSTTPVRDYPIDKFREVAKYFYNNGYEVILIAPQGTITTKDKLKPLRVINLAETNHAWEEQVTMIKTCDVFCGNDSGNTHFASAMGVNTVALYGSFHWKDRSGIWPNVRSIQGRGPCEQCYHHPSPVFPWPKGKPCEKSGKCEVLNGIEVDRVINKIKSFL